MNSFYFLFCTFFFSSFCFGNQTQTLYEGKGVIWGFDFISKNEIIFTQKKGALFYYNFLNKKLKKLPSPPVKAKGQGGLLDVKSFHFQDHHFIYLTYSEQLKDNLTTSLARGVWKNGELRELKTLFRAKVKGKGGRHFGSRLAIKNNKVFMTIGDRGKRDLAQDLSWHNGKILRLDLNGKSAAGNPFFNHKKALPEIWSYGHRNPQGIDIHPLNNEIYSCEFGPRGGDELNLIQKSLNYGWPLITYGKEYWGPSIGPTHKQGMVQPLTYWVPSISPSGMAFYTGDKIKKWKNNLFLANLSSQHLRRLEIKDNKVVKQEVLLKSLSERIRQVKNGPDGYLYISTDSGKILKILN